MKGVMGDDNSTNSFIAVKDVDLSSKKIVIHFPQSFGNHNSPTTNFVRTHWGKIIGDCIGLTGSVSYLDRYLDQGHTCSLICHS